jgi:urocanate hydratase
LQGTYETFMGAARQHFGGTLAGRLLLTSGCGGMSGAQPLAGKLAGASTLVVEVDQARIDRRIASGYCDAATSDLDEAIKLWFAARDARKPLALALCANSAVVLPELVRRGIVPDIVTDQTYCDPLKGYVPAELTVEQARAMRKDAPEKLMALARKSTAAHFQAKPRRLVSRMCSGWDRSSISSSGLYSAKAWGRSVGSRFPVIRRTFTRSTR